MQTRKQQEKQVFSGKLVHKPCDRQTGSGVRRSTAPVRAHLLSPSLQMLGTKRECFPGSRLVVMKAFLSAPKRFTQSMNLDDELGRLTLERGTMLGPPTEAERAEERTRKELARKVCGLGLV